MLSTSQGGKRKSVACEGTENAPPNKRVTSALPQPTTKRASALPRFQASTRSKVVTHDIRKEAGENPLQVKTGVDKKTPVKQSLSQVDKVIASASKPAPRTPVRKSRRRQPTTPPADQIRQMFDSSFSVTEERFYEILGGMKMKKYCSDKDKATKFQAVVNELKGALKTTLEEVKAVKVKCVATEVESIGLIHDTHIELQEAFQCIENLSTSESRLTQEVTSLTHSVNSKTKKLAQMELERSAIKEKVAEGEVSVNQLSIKMATEQALREQAENDVGRLRVELNQAKQETTDILLNAREKYEQKMDQSINDYRDELVALKSDLARKQGDLDRLVSEKADAEEKLTNLKESHREAERLLKDADSNAVRNDKELDRLATELQQSKEQLSQKDDDLRSTLKSLQEVQREGSEEKNTLRSESSAMQQRIMGLEEERLSVTAQLATKKEEAISANRETSQLKESMSVLQSKIQLQEQELALSKEAMVQLEVERELRALCEIREENERRERTAVTGTMVAIQNECSQKMNTMELDLERATHKHQQEIQTLTVAKDDAIEQSKTAADQVMGMESEVASLKDALHHASANHESVEKLGKVTGELEILRKRVRETTESQSIEQTMYIEKLRALEEQVRHGEVCRRQMHNKIQELRGNVRVYARVRPFLSNDGIDLSAALPEPSIQTKSDGASLKISKKVANVAGGSEGKIEEFPFTFDKVFGPSSTQETVFTEVSEFVQSALDGYNVCLFSYGQTGSGKTHTMQGSGNGDMKGIIPRAMNQVGQYKTELEGKGWVYHMQVTFVEIYNETIRDLLRVNANEEIKHDIKKDPHSGAMAITDVTSVTVDLNNSDEIDNVMEMAARHRSVGTTSMNERSSRSHSVFTLHLKATNAEQQTALYGTLSLVDLAGSERLDRSGATGDQLKETVAINKSLSALTDVFVALGNKQTHVPFRNSKLTYLLQSALSGDGKTLMLANLSPTEESYYESLCSLRFAAQVNQCELGKPKRQVKDAASSGATAAPTSTASNSLKAAVVNTPKATSSTPKKAVLPARSRTAPIPSSAANKKLKSTI